MTEVDLSCTDSTQPTHGCRRQFPFKDYPGLCARCLHLSQLTSPEQIKQDAAAPFCAGCGGIFAHLAPNTQCGICERKTANLEGHGTASSSSQDIQAMKFAVRKDAVAARVLPTKKVTPVAQAAATVTKSATAVSGVHTGREILVYLSPVVPKGTALWTKLGLANDSFPDTFRFDDAIDKLLDIWNVKWNFACKESLKIEFIDLHFHGNVSFLPESDVHTIGHFYDVHERILNKDPTKRLPSSLKPGKGPFIYLEGSIDVPKFEQTTGVLAPDWIKTAKELTARKRKSIGLPESELALSSALKRTKAIPAQLQSTWVVRAPQGTTKIALLFATIEVDEKEHTTQVWYPTTEENLKTGYIADEEFGRGATKLVYKLILDNKEWAAKRFWTIGQENSSTVSVKDNKTEIENEGLRLYQLKEILGEFMKHARRNQVDISRDIRVTDFFIAIEAVNNGKPSPASGISSLTYSTLDKAKSEYIVWLLEPMRPGKKPTKWSGTMQHPDHNSKIGDTLTSFVHFAYQWTKKSVVFADLQTQRAEDSGWQVLFDVMTHTLGGDSGVGDHGLSGIQAFIDDHQCDRKCRDLLLAPLSSSSPDENREDQGEDSEEEPSDNTNIARLFTGYGSEDE